MKRQPSDILRSWIALGKGGLKYLWFLGLVLYGVILWRLGWTPIRDTVASIRVWPLLGALGIEAASLWLRVYKWRLALGAGAVGGTFVFSVEGGGQSVAAGYAGASDG